VSIQSEKKNTPQRYFLSKSHHEWNVEEALEKYAKEYSMQGAFDQIKKDIQSIINTNNYTPKVRASVQTVFENLEATMKEMETKIRMLPSDLNSDQGFFYQDIASIGKVARYC
jgi:predicted  nucleic acid-binding Zn-ribbon protein